MKYPLEELLRVRIFRQDNAQTEVTTKRIQVSNAEDNLKQKKQELEDYIAWREQRETELYREIFEQEVQVRDLDDLKINISLLREKQLRYAEAVQKAEQELRDAQDALTEARAQLAKASRDREKIDEHKGIWADEEAKRNEAEMDKEMEDFRVRQAEFEE